MLKFVSFPLLNKNSSQKNWTSWHHLLHKEILGNKTLIPDGANLLIAVSGGQDSMALLNLINDMKTQQSYQESEEKIKSEKIDSDLEINFFSILLH